MRFIRSVVLALLAAASLAGPSVAQEPADLVVTNAVIHTADPDAPAAEAFAVDDGAFVAVGTTEEIEAFAGPDTERLDLDGLAVVPGLIDAHGHVLGLGRALRIVDLVGTESPEEIAALVREAAAGRDPGTWILGRGWDQNDWAEGRRDFPTHEILDEAAPDHPVWLTRIDGHAGWANARAMEVAGIAAGTPDLDGGRIVRDDEGEPTGVFIDNAEDLVAGHIPDPGPEERAAQLAAAQDHMVAVGLTGAHDMGAGPETLALYREWDAGGRLAPRIAAYVSGGSDDAFRWWEETGRALHGAGGERYAVPGFKLYADGALGSRGAWLIGDYTDDPGNRGLPVTPPEKLTARTVWTMELGLQPAIHAIGDRGNRVALEAIETGLAEVEAREAPRATARPPGLSLASRIEHAQVIALEDIPRFAELGVIASVQPTHATSDMYWAEERVGPDRIRGAYAWGELREAGAQLACGSDFPVERANPFHGLYAVITRMDQEGWPEGGWYPDEAMTREQALACFTRDAAAAAGMDDEVGSIAVGKRADFVVIDRDLMTVPVEEIWRIGVVRTVIDGETVYEAAGE